MPYFDLVCRGCGYEKMELDKTLKKAYCPACGRRYVRDDVVNNYNQNQWRVANIEQVEHVESMEHIDRIDRVNVNVNAVGPYAHIEKRLENAHAFMTVFNDYPKARALFQGITDDEPLDYRGWWGLVTVETMNFNCQALYDSLEDPKHHVFSMDAYQKALKVAPSEIKNGLKSKWENFLREFYEFVGQQEKKELMDKQRAIYQKIEHLQESISQIKIKQKKLFWWNLWECMTMPVLLLAVLLLWSATDGGILVIAVIVLAITMWYASEKDRVIKEDVPVWEKQMEEQQEKLRQLKQEYVQINKKIVALSD